MTGNLYGATLTMITAFTLSESDEKARSDQSPFFQASAFRIVLDAHRREGFDAGYRRAISDVLASTIFVAEKALQRAERGNSNINTKTEMTKAPNMPPVNARQVLYHFIELLEHETLQHARTDEVDGGLGI
jgi:hypothetical protein